MRRRRRHRQPGRDGRPTRTTDRSEICGKLLRRLIPARRIRVDAVPDELIDGLGDRRIDRAHGRWRLRHAAEELRHRAFGVRGLSPPDQHVHQDQAERVDVGTMIDRGALRLLGRHVLERADDRARHRAAARSGHRARNPEVGDQGAVFLVEQDVSGLEIAVHDAGFMRRDEPGDDLAGDAQRARDRQRPPVSINLARSEPWMYGIVMYLTPSISPRS